MNVKVGQWVRNENEVYKITDIFWKDERYFYSVEYVEEIDTKETKEHNFWGLTTNKENENRSFNITLRDYMIKENFKVADTPQELVQVGDLVEHKKYSNVELERVLSNGYSGAYNIETENNYLDYEDVISIYTPNEDGSKYTRQWRKD